MCNVNILKNGNSGITFTYSGEVHFVKIFDTKASIYLIRDKQHIFLVGGLILGGHNIFIAWYRKDVADCI